MPLCGSSRCGCALVSVPATSGAVSGQLPTIEVAGNGTPTSPWNLTFNPDWVDAIAALVSAPTAWTDVTFQNSWVNNGSAGQPRVQYRKVGEMVHLRGSMKNGTANAVAFTFPVGYRPPSSFVVPVATENPQGHIDLDFKLDGTVSVTNYFNDTVGTWVYLPYIIFSTV